MPLEAYRDPASPARAAVVLEDTEEWVMPESPALLEHEPLFPPPEDEPLFPPPEELWSAAPAFDWGD